MKSKNGAKFAFHAVMAFCCERRMQVHGQVCVCVGVGVNDEFLVGKADRNKPRPFCQY